MVWERSVSRRRTHAGAEVARGSCVMCAFEGQTGLFAVSKVTLLPKYHCRATDVPPPNKDIVNGNKKYMSHNMTLTS
eukprot:1082535-Amphidinium_carterae.1